jgi:hypothetical protein
VRESDHRFPDAHSRPQRRRRLPAGFISVADMADISDSARSTVYRQIELGRLPAWGWRGITIIAESAAQEFLAVKPRHIGGNAVSSESGNE